MLQANSRFLTAEERFGMTCSAVYMCRKRGVKSLRQGSQTTKRAAEAALP